jgi:hypothetical protein
MENIDHLKLENIALETALAAVLYEAKAMGIDTDSLCKKAKSGIFDSSKPYRWASSSVVVPAGNAIDRALKI